MQLLGCTALTSPPGTITFGYDALSRRTSMTLPNGVVTNYSYDAASQLTSLLHHLSGSPVASFAYSYDRVGNRTAMTELAGANTYVYDQLNRLAQATHPQPSNPTEGFAYDPVGNRTLSHLASGQVHDAANRLLEDSNFTYTYDANGNLAQKVQKGTGEATTYTYDVENQLVGVSKPGLLATYRYDALGRRIEKNVNGMITRYVYDNEDILMELDASNAVLARYTHGPGIDEPLVMLRGGQSFFYHTDGLGSITQLTDATGAIARSYVYDAFGRIAAQAGTVTNPYTYTGREFDPETGLHYYRARHYDPFVGRFLQEDPIAFGGGSSNFYQYVQSNPINFTDPTGLATSIGCRPVKSIVGILFKHCFIRIIPEPGSPLGSDPLTLSLLTNDWGFPQPGMAWKVLNDPIDVAVAASHSVAVPCGFENEDVFDQAVFNAFKRHPETVLYSNNPFNELGIFNSNTFVRRIIESAGGRLPDGLPSNLRAPGLRAPSPQGFDMVPVPVPIL